MEISARRDKGSSKEVWETRSEEDKVGKINSCAVKKMEERTFLRDSRSKRREKI